MIVREFALRLLRSTLPLLIALMPVSGLAQSPDEIDVEQDAADLASDLDLDSETEILLVEPSTDMEEIVIEGTATQGLKEVPIAVTQFGASDLKNLRIQNVADLAAYTPNLEINTAFAASSPTLFIRGVGLKDYNSNSTGAVGIWHDGIQINSPAAQLFSLYDIASIEVIRGPIGKLNGRNSTAGAIRIHSVMPDGEYSSTGSFTYGNLNEISYEGAVGFPIAPDFLKETLSARVSFVTEFRDGYTKNHCSGWDPESHGLLESTEARTQSLYQELEPELFADPVFGDLYIYRNIELVEEVRTSIEAPINIGTLSDGQRVGIQRDILRIAGDGVCLGSSAGDLLTDKGEFSPNGGTPPIDGEAGIAFDVNENALPLSRYQDLKGKYNDIKYWALRGQLLFEPTDNLDFHLTFHWGQNRGDSFHLQSVGVRNKPITDRSDVQTDPLDFTEEQYGQGFSELNPSTIGFEGTSGRSGLFSRDDPNAPGFAGGDPYAGFYSRDGQEILDLLGGSITANYEFDYGRVVVISGYDEVDRLIEDEGDDCPCIDLEADYKDQSWQVTEEVRVEGEFARFSWVVGGFYLYEELESSNGFPSIRGEFLGQAFDQATEAWNVGLNLSYDFFEEDFAPGLYQITLEGGARYNYEHKSFTLGTVAINNAGVDLRPPIPEQTEFGKWTEPTGEITLSWKPIETARFYGKFTRGFKAGHFNAGVTSDPNFETPTQPRVVTQSLSAVKPEFIDAYEIGFKGSFLDDRIEVSAAAFIYDYQDLQVFDIVNEIGANPTQQLLNADADVTGAEIELTLRPLEGLLVRGSFAWLDTEFGDFPVSKQVIAGSVRNPRGATANFNYEGNRLIAAPEFSASGYAEYELPLYRWGSLIPGFDFSYKSKVFLDPAEEDLISQDGYWLFGARLAYRTPGGNIEVSGWVRNMLNEHYKSDVFDLSREFNFVTEIWSEPRTYGMTVTYLW